MKSFFLFKNVFFLFSNTKLIKHGCEIIFQYLLTQSIQYKNQDNFCIIFKDFYEIVFQL